MSDQAEPQPITRPDRHVARSAADVRAAILRTSGGEHPRWTRSPDKTDPPPPPTVARSIPSKVVEGLVEAFPVVAEAAYAAGQAATAARDRILDLVDIAEESTLARLRMQPPGRTTAPSAGFADSRIPPRDPAESVVDPAEPVVDPENLRGGRNLFEQINNRIRQAEREGQRYLSLTVDPQDLGPFMQANPKLLSPRINSIDPINLTIENGNLVMAGTIEGALNTTIQLTRAELEVLDGRLQLVVEPEPVLTATKFERIIRDSLLQNGRTVNERIVQRITAQLINNWGVAGFFIDDNNDRLGINIGRRQPDGRIPSPTPTMPIPTGEPFPTVIRYDALGQPQYGNLNEVSDVLGHRPNESEATYLRIGVSAQDLRLLTDAEQLGIITFRPEDWRYLSDTTHTHGSQVAIAELLKARGLSYEDLVAFIRVETPPNNPEQQPLLLASERGSRPVAEMLGLVEGQYQDSLYSVSAENIRPVEDSEQYIFRTQGPFIILHPESPGTWHASEYVVDFAYNHPLARPRPVDSSNIRYANGERITWGDSGLLALAAAATPNVEDQARLYNHLATAILAIHQNNPDLQQQWLDAQYEAQHAIPNQWPRSSYDVFVYNDQNREVRTNNPDDPIMRIPGRPDEEQLLAYEPGTNPPIVNRAAFATKCKRTLGELRAALATGTLEPYQLRQLEFFAHPIDIGKMVLDMKNTLNTEGYPIDEFGDPFRT